jgi:hypothetical protein
MSLKGSTAMECFAGGALTRAAGDEFSGEDADTCGRVSLIPASEKSNSHASTTASGKPEITAKVTQLSTRAGKSSVPLSVAATWMSNQPATA